ncbi:Fatty acid cis/trans isomerase (CTI) [Spongiibacter sp. IMCC21906]|uniref:fatty acid cis/trans isomerase n=1 Tax=Spongiibacter sp. IMCC21906 TaxID=1620392 RepID=UPI00062DF6CD|nr:fatty acid cis/trans isomerase [Spongiibacter sp. IMCC21906]AKH68005.1 Fatty acid cis/trans isomerase (CTI) [Spongiibacter sp. IMCC21906]
MSHWSSKPPFRHAALSLLLFILVGCATYMAMDFDSRFGPADAEQFETPKTTGSVDYQADIKPILESRCIVCHACYDSPCQLKLGSYEGLTRGGSKAPVYDGARIFAADPSRLHTDGMSVSDWREKGFFPVLNEREDSPEANIEAGLMAQLLLQKQAHPQPSSGILPDSFDFSLGRDQQCPQIEEYASYLEDYPLWGMPYGLPALDSHDHSLLMRWLEEGAPYKAKTPTVSAELQKTLDHWESFFNQNSPKAQLMSRYIYEHLFLAHLYFSDAMEGSDGTPQFYELVRSSTPPDKPLKLISTRLPFDDPGVDRVYYRLRAVQDTLVVKAHLPYQLNKERMDFWTSLFIDADYSVSSLPSYEPAKAANPFVTFKQIPFRSRYRFMLEEAAFTIMGFIKGPVCRGQTALNVINDHFWVTFMNPELEYGKESEANFGKVLRTMGLPAESEENASVVRWMKYAEQEKEYLKAKYQFINKLDDHVDLDRSLIWNGDGDNDNASLTIYRHFDSATVIKGLHGDKPQTAWVISYPLLERIHYLLVAGYDVYGNVGHQLNTRIYMDFLRMEGEFDFLLLIPKDRRQAVRKQWYQGSVSVLEKYLNVQMDRIQPDSGIEYSSNDPLMELYGILKHTLKTVQPTQYELSNGFTDKASIDALDAIENLPAAAIARLPQSAILAIESDDEKQRHYYTVLHHNKYTNISHMFGDEDRRQPQRDTVSVLYGIASAYPSVFISVKKAELSTLVKQLQNISNEEDYASLLTHFGVRRSNPRFWDFSDTLHKTFKKAQPITSGLLDYNRLENR